MEQAQTRALAALQPFLHLALTAKSSSPRILADLITRATSAPGTFYFADLLQTPAIQSLRSTGQSEEARAQFTVLQIFTYGTLADYKTTANLPPLNFQQEHKLRLLSLLSVICEPNPLTYSQLKSVLSLSSDAALESLVTEAIYLGLIVGRLSPTSNPPAVHITSVVPFRDLPPNSLPDILKVLQVWENRCSTTINDLEAQIDGIRQSALDRRQRQLSQQKAVGRAILSSNLTGQGNAGASDAGKEKERLVPYKELGLRGEMGEEPRKSRGIGNKRDLDEQQQDEVGEGGITTRSAGNSGGEGEDEGVGSGLARMEVDEGVDQSRHSAEAGRTSKRAVGKKRV